MRAGRRRAGKGAWRQASTHGLGWAYNPVGAPMAFVYHVELTNACDLECAYCPLTTSTRAPSTMKEETFVKVVEHMRRLSPLNFAILHHFGEPLLHPELPRFVELAAAAHLNPGFSTNGETLTRARFEELCDRGLRWMCVTFHTAAGARTYQAMLGPARARGLFYWGRELVDTPAGHDPEAIFNYGIERQLKHTFAGAVGPAPMRPPGGRPACDYLDRNFVCVLHDGRVVSCAMDERAENVLGTVDDLDRIVQQPSYELCRTCEGFTFYAGFRALAGRLLGERPLRMDPAGFVEHLAIDDDPRAWSRAAEAR
jgi:hypothetical protein